MHLSKKLSFVNQKVDICFSLDLNHKNSEMNWNELKLMIASIVKIISIVHLVQSICDKTHDIIFRSDEKHKWYVWTVHIVFYDICSAIIFNKCLPWLFAFYEMHRHRFRWPSLFDNIAALAANFGVS